MQKATVMANVQLMIVRDDDIVYTKLSNLAIANIRKSRDNL